MSLWWRDKPGAKSPIDKQKWFSYPDQVTEMAAFAKSKADKDVYLTVGLYSEDRRVPDNVTLISSVYQDSDTFDHTGYRCAPSMTVQTSEGRTHNWFTLDKPYPAEQVELVTRKMTYAHRADGNDVSSWGKNKVLRVPGTVNTSHEGFPEDVTVEYTGAIYTLQEIANLYDDVSLTPIVKAPVALTDVAKTVAITPVDLPNFLDAQSMLPGTFDLRLITQEPEIGSEGNRSQMRERLILECMRSGLDDAHTAAVAWNSKCGEKYHEGREDLLWYEIAKFRAIFDLESGANTQPPAPEEKVIPMGRPKNVDILTKEQRKIARAHWDNTFPGEYERYVRQALDIYNTPYHNAMTWMILSSVVGQTGALRRGKRTIPLNLFIIPIGKTTTGKSEAMAYATDVIHGAFPKGENPDIGDDSSQGALAEKLHKRSGKVTLFKSDEADGLIGQMTDKGSWRAGMLQFWTYLYDGRVPPQNRRGDVDGEWADCIFTMCIMGTEKGLTDVLTRKMFETGYLARQCWFIGEDIEVPESKLGVEEGSIDDALADRVQIEKWADRWTAVRQSWEFRRMSAGGEYIRFETPEVAAFFKKTTAHLEKHMFKNHPNYDIIKPSVGRISVSMWKMAALVAVEDGRTTISMKDVLLALMQGEELLGNLEYMSGTISSSVLAKQVNDLEMWLAGRMQQIARVEEIYRAFNSLSKQEVDSLLTQLTSQGRVGMVRATDKSISYEIRGA